ncbi:MAG TPA: hypothetical protein VGG33_05050 [Polyangia bacterium]
MDLPSSSHLIYIPLVLVLGLVFGFIWGAKATQESYTLEAKRVADLAKRKAERKAAREAQDEVGGATSEAPDAPTPGANLPKG